MLTQCNILTKGGPNGEPTDGAYYWYTYKSLKDGSYVEVECSKADYLSTKPCSQTAPPMDGYVCNEKNGDYRYDTASGRLDEGCYAVDGNQYVIRQNGVYLKAPLTAITKGVLDMSQVTSKFQLDIPTQIIPLTK